MIDKISQQRINQLHPYIRQRVIDALTYVNTKVLDPKKAYVRIAQGLRTFPEQDDLYAQGRTKPGKIVTNAPAGSSYHNYGLAVDIVLIINGKEASWDIAKDYNGDGLADWMQVVDIFEKKGFYWGGDFKSIKDYPHFEWNISGTVKELKTKYDKKLFIPNTTYVKL